MGMGTWVTVIMILTLNGLLNEKLTQKKQVPFATKYQVDVSSLTDQLSNSTTMRLYTPKTAETSNSTSKDIASASASSTTQAQEEEEDEYYARIRRTGCFLYHEKMQDCYYEKKDWRQCKEEMKLFRQCFASHEKEREKMDVKDRLGKREPQ
jgi:cytochrome c oxidase assembly factor 4